MTADLFHIARLPCGCVESALLPTDNDSDRDTFLRHYPHATAEPTWPRIKCDRHAEVSA